MPAGREGPVGDDAPDGRVARGDAEGGATASADAEEGDPGRVAVVAGAEVGQGRPEVDHLAVGDPLEGDQARLRAALAVVAEVEGEEVEADLAEALGVGGDAPAVPLELVAEDDDAGPRGGGRRVVRAGQVDPVAGGEAHVLARLRLRAERQHHGGLLEDPGHDRGVADPDVGEETRQGRERQEGREHHHEGRRAEHERSPSLSSVGVDSYAAEPRPDGKGDAGGRIVKTPPTHSFRAVSRTPCPGLLEDSISGARISPFFSLTGGSPQNQGDVLPPEPEAVGQRDVDRLIA